MWDRVIGQERATGQLARAAERPVHAYLLVGPRGSGAEQAARCFAAELVAPGDERAWSLAERGMHPDIVEIDPAETQIRVEHAATVIREAALAPVEGARRVVIVLEADRMNETTANKLLKTLEEPPGRAVIVLVTASPDELLETVRSRCLRIDLDALDTPTVLAALERAGVESERARLAAALAGGRLDRAHALAGRLATLRDAFARVASELDGTGATVVRLADELDEAMKEAVVGVREGHEDQVTELEAEIERSAYPDRAAQGLRKRLSDRHKREDRRARTDALVEGITALETVYRDALVGPDARINLDRQPLSLDPRACAAALDACRDARTALAEHNPNETVLLERLLLHLPQAVAPVG